MASPATLWDDPQCAFQVECSPETMDRIRIAVVDGFYALPRGGLEIGGVLLGKHEGALVRITDWVAIECEHLTGPSFVLSAGDEEALDAQLADLGPRAVGWFHSHTRSEISFSPKDIAVHDRFFPQPWQVGLVLKPENLQPLRANYFFRSNEGLLVGGGGEFIVEAGRNDLVSRTANAGTARDSSRPARARQAPVSKPDPVPLSQSATGKTAAALPLGQPTAIPSANPVARPAAIRSTPVTSASGSPPASTLQQPVTAPPIREERQTPTPPSEPIPPAATAAAASAAWEILEPVAAPKLPPNPVAPPVFAASVQERTPKRNSMLARTLRLAAIVMVLALAAAAYVTRDSWMRHSPEPLKLQASDEEGKLLIRWTPVRDGSSGRLLIQDGEKNVDIALDGLQLSRGIYLYHRQAENDTVHLKVGEREDTTSFAGPLPAPVQAAEVKSTPPPVQAETKVKTDRPKRAGRRRR